MLFTVSHAPSSCALKKASFLARQFFGQDYKPQDKLMLLHPVKPWIVNKNQIFNSIIHYSCFDLLFTFLVCQQFFQYFGGKDIAKLTPRWTQSIKSASESSPFEETITQPFIGTAQYAYSLCVNSWVCA
jgi:hypothetical protein